MVSLILFIGMASIFDLKNRCIPNLLLLGFSIIFSLELILFREFHELFQIFVGVLITLIVLCPLFLFRQLGSGDIKFLMVLGLKLSLKMTLMSFVLGLYLSFIPALFWLIHGKRKNVNRKKIPMIPFMSLGLVILHLGR